MSEIGESLVGAYLNHIVGCEVVVYNSYFSDRQGEIDVVGIKSGPPRAIWICEVTTHIGGMDLRRGTRTNAEVMESKLANLRYYAEMAFPGEDHRFEWWSPSIRPAQLVDADAAKAAWAAEGRSLTFVTNATYTERVRDLIVSANANPSQTSEPAYRMLQILARLKGEGEFTV